MKISEDTGTPSPSKKDIPWLGEVTKEDKFFKTTDFSQKTLAVEHNITTLTTYLYNHEICSLAEISHIRELLPATLDLNLFENNAYNQNFIIHRHENQLFIRNFFFRTLILNLREEVITFILYQKLLALHTEQAPFLTKLFAIIKKYTPTFLAERSKILDNPHDFKVMYALVHEYFHHFLEGLIFTALIHNSSRTDFTKTLTRLEKKHLNEIIFAKKIKRFLGMHEKSYNYIEQTALINQCTPTEQEQFYTLSTLFETEKKPFTAFVEDDLATKRIVFWCCWTLSPFLAPDISDFLTALNLRFTLRKVYIDLPAESTATIRKYMQIKTTHLADEDLLNHELEKIYPIFIPDYAKETLPYIVFFEKLKLFDLPLENIECIGFDGDDLMMKRPVAHDQSLVFNIDGLWEQKILDALDQAPTLAEDELILFFYFLKPVHAFPKQVVTDDTHISRVLHTDIFTGFGPERPINSLARYSKYAHNQPQSFAFTNIANSPLAREKIIFYPSEFTTKALPPLPLDASSFNAFNLYNALLYSTSKGGGQLEPVVPTKDVHYSY
ncbi:hypothetical protein COTS27_01051 [Spirochaetota bacterium]|nr:hypothetical protein COTS27_01051 [Spirochaetota bacterium]